MSKKPRLEKGEAWSVVSKPEDGFNRSGKRFTKIPTILTDEEMTGTIFNEPMLIVEKVKISEKKEEKEPGGKESKKGESKK